MVVLWLQLPWYFLHHTTSSKPQLKKEQYVHLRNYVSPIWKFQFWTAKHDLQCAAATCGGVMCSCNLRCACGTHFGSNLWYACVRCIFRVAKCNHNIAHFFGNNERTDNWNLLAFGVSYDFVAQKWRILAIFHKKKINFLEINWKGLRFKTMFKS